MRTARFHVFSGTGNSLHLARMTATLLAASGMVAEIRIVDGRVAPLTLAEEGRAEGDLDLFVFPVYALSLPRIMEGYMKRLGGLGSGHPRPRAALLATNGRISARIRDGHEGQALAQGVRVLRRRGWDPVYSETFDYPQNISSLVPIQDEARRRAIMVPVLPKIRAVAADLAAGRRRLRPCSPAALLLGWPFGWLYRLVGRPTLALLFAADEGCDGCGLCAARCPAGALSLGRKRPRWSYACEGCERCMNGCPKGAIQTSLLRVLLVLGFCVLVLALPPRSLLPGLPSGLPGPLLELLWLVLATALGLGLLRLVDLVLHRLDRLAFLRPILSYGPTRGQRRYSPPLWEDKADEKGGQHA
jgi:ferredoxin